MTGPANDDKSERRWRKLRVFATAWGASVATARFLWELIKAHGQ
jgi:hypothetical protein